MHALELYRTALTCPSALSAGRRVASSYERLEFLGDAVLSLVVRQKVLRIFPDKDEVRIPGIPAFLSLDFICCHQTTRAHVFACDRPCSACCTDV